jgi:hypothetical protein
MDAYEEFLAVTVGPAVKLRDYIIGLKRMNKKQSEELERLQKLCKRIISGSENMLSSGVDCDYRYELGRKSAAMEILEAREEG